MDRDPKNDSQRLTYSTYLKIGELISLQHPQSKPVAHDELLFIVVHQTYELWFKVVIFELDAMIGHLAKDNFLGAYHLLDRVCEVFRVMIQQIDVLETMTPVEFNRFRSHINPASGFQSFQFREFELLAGADPGDYRKFFDLEPEWKARLEARANRPNLRQAFLSVLKRHGLVKNETPEEIQNAILACYSDDPKYRGLQPLCEHLIRFDEQIQLWRFRHVQMVERMIGMKKGTGGSLGVSYLQSTLRKRYFPELWQVRTAMDGDGKYGV